MYDAYWEEFKSCNIYRDDVSQFWGSHSEGTVTDWLIE